MNVIRALGPEQLFEVGHYTPQGEWHTVSGILPWNEAVDLCNVLNGGNGTGIHEIVSSIDTSLVSISSLIDTAIGRQFGSIS